MMEIDRNRNVGIISKNAQELCSHVI